MRSPKPDAVALQARIPALSPLFELMNPMVVQTLIRYVTTALPTSSPLRDRVVDAISPKTRTMVPSVYDEMRAEGFAEARIAGKLEAKLGFLPKLLVHRGLVLDEPLRARVLACTDEAQHERWFDRALVATTLADVFDEP